MTIAEVLVGSGRRIHTADVGGMNIILHEKIGNGIFKDGQVWLPGDNVLHPLRVAFLVALRPCCTDGRTARGVERLFLKGRLIRIESHFAAQGVKLIDEMAFGQTADGRVAGHPCDGIFPSGDEKGLYAHPRGGQSSLHACMSTADHDQIELFIHAAELYHHTLHLSTLF